MLALFLIKFQESEDIADYDYGNGCDFDDDDDNDDQVESTSSAASENLPGLYRKPLT